MMIVQISRITKNERRKAIQNAQIESVVSKMENLKNKRKDPSRMKENMFIFKRNTYNKIKIHNHILAREFKGDIFHNSKLSQCDEVSLWAHK